MPAPIPPMKRPAATALVRPSLFLRPLKKALFGFPFETSLELLVFFCLFLSPESIENLSSSFSPILLLNSMSKSISSSRSLSRHDLCDLFDNNDIDENDDDEINDEEKQVDASCLKVGENERYPQQ